VTASDGIISAPAGGFAFLAPAQDACEGDACVIPGASNETAAASLLRGDVRDGRVEG
jgi:hypothetical protein